MQGDKQLLLHVTDPAGPPLIADTLSSIVAEDFLILHPKEKEYNDALKNPENFVWTLYSMRAQAQKELPRPLKPLANLRRFITQTDLHDSSQQESIQADSQQELLE